MKGYAQQAGIDFEETFSPVAHFESVWIFLVFTAQQQQYVYQFDVKLAFLNGILMRRYMLYKLLNYGKFLVV